MSSELLLENPIEKPTETLVKPSTETWTCKNCKYDHKLQPGLHLENTCESPDCGKKGCSKCIEYIHVPTHILDKLNFQKVEEEGCEHHHVTSYH